MVAPTSRQWIIMELGEQAYGFDVNHVREIVSLRNMHLHRIPQTPAFVEGVILLRDRPIGVIDVRSTLGLCSLHKETEGIAQVLREREEDHCRWIQELEACVLEQREFRLTTDPHKCKFGQWYDKVLGDAQGLARLTNSDLGLIALLGQLDQPHKRIHAIAQRVLSHATAGRICQARQILDEARNTELCLLRQIFSQCRAQMEIVRRGVLFVFTDEEGAVGGLVDRVSEVVRLSEDQIRPVDCAIVEKGMLDGVAQLGDTGRMVQLLNVPAIARVRRSHPSLKLPCPA